MPLPNWRNGGELPLAIWDESVLEKPGKHRPGGPGDQAPQGRETWVAWGRPLPMSDAHRAALVPPDNLGGWLKSDIIPLARACYKLSESSVEGVSDGSTSSKLLGTKFISSPSTNNDSVDIRFQLPPPCRVILFFGPAGRSAPWSPGNGNLLRSISPPCQTPAHTYGGQNNDQDIASSHHSLSNSTTRPAKSTFPTRQPASCQAAA